MARFSACAVCMKVCPVQKYGMKPVLEHYAETGEVLGKGTHELEAYTLEGKGYYGPGELPHFDHDFFQIPHSSSEDALFRDLKTSLENHEIPEGTLGDDTLREFRAKVEKAINKREGEANAMAMLIPDEDD